MLAGFPDILGVADLYLHRRCGPVLTENRKCCGNRKAQPRRVPAWRWRRLQRKRICHVGCVPVLSSSPSPLCPSLMATHTQVKQFLAMLVGTHPAAVGLDCGGVAQPSGCSSLSCVVLYWTPIRSCPHVFRSSSSSSQGCVVAGRSWFCGASVIGRGGTQSTSVCGKQCWR